jgi:hypothetical protein
MRERIESVDFILTVRVSILLFVSHNIGPHCLKAVINIFGGEEYETTL